MKQIIKKYLFGITNDKFHRYRSWDYCNEVFSAEQEREDLSLQLAFYLASWGMYRGSGGLLQKNHLVHKGAVEILYSIKHQPLKCNRVQEVTRSNILDILRLKKELSDYYVSIPFIRGVEEPKPISPTDTLISKILLGAYACVPAYDRYFIDGLKEKGLNKTKFSEASLNELFDFIDENKDEIFVCDQLIKDKISKHYPVMKILDMYFWQIGYDKEIENKKIKT